MKRSRKASLYSYLDSTKVLETGSEQDIASAKKNYWRMYKAEWRKNQRKRTIQVTITLTETEAKQTKEAARKHKRSHVQFLKEAAFSYLAKRYLIPDIIAVKTIQQLLEMNLNVIRDLIDTNMLPFEIGRRVTKEMDELRTQVTEQLRNPVSIEQCKS